jgi:hypothetical protein
MMMRFLPGQADQRNDAHHGLVVQRLPFLAALPFTNDHFTKTGSKQTLGKLRGGGEKR